MKWEFATFTSKEYWDFRLENDVIPPKGFKGIPNVVLVNDGYGKSVLQCDFDNDPDFKAENMFDDEDEDEYVKLKDRCVGHMDSVISTSVHLNNVEVKGLKFNDGQEELVYWLLFNPQVLTKEELDRMD